MKLYIDEVSFNNEDFINLGFANETWEFSTSSISTPNGSAIIIGGNIVNNEQWRGVELVTVENTIDLSAYKGFNGNGANPNISVVVFVRQPYNVWLWVYLFDDDGNNVATFCGHEDLDEFPRYIEEIEEYIKDDEDFDDGIEVMLRFIPDALDKKSSLENQWVKRGLYYDYPDTRSYVKSLATDDDVEDFFGWLFNDSRLRGCKEWDLEPVHRKAYENFLNLFNSLDDC